MMLDGPHRRFLVVAGNGTEVQGRPVSSLDTILTQLSRLKYRIWTRYNSNRQVFT